MVENPLTLTLSPEDRGEGIVPAPSPPRTAERACLLISLSPFRGRGLG
jgi:hypothetical protein